MPDRNKLSLKIKKPLLWRLLLAAIAGVLVIYLIKDRGGSESEGVTFVARRGPLDITVLEGGSAQALESQEIKCEVRVGYQGTKILKIVDEGYQVTDEDVKNGKVLVELDSSEIQKQVVQQEIQFQSAAAALIDAQQGYEIQLNQNLSDVKAAEQKARFARMDFDKFLGDQATAAILKELKLDRILEPGSTNGPSQAPLAMAPGGAGPEHNPPAEAGPAGNGPSGNGSGGSDAGGIGSSGETPAPTAQRTVLLANLPVKGKSEIRIPPEPDPPAALSPELSIDFSKYADINVLGDGEAKQKLRKFDDDLGVARKELGQAKSTREGTQRLFERGFVTKTDLERDEIAYENSRLKVQTAETARDLFLKYEFPKSAEEALSKYTEAVRELDRARKSAVAKLAQAEAKLKSSEAQHNVQTRQRKELSEQLEKCVIKSLKPGLVVYGSGRNDMYYYGNQEPIREGATVRERQAIITIPDMTKMSVEVRIHESYIKKVKKGQKARITVDAFPDTILDGEVIKVGVLPDSQNRWMNPDMKVYLTSIGINGVHDWLKPGMSTKVEVFVSRLEDVVYVPLQAVSPSDGKQVCYVVNGAGQERREVEVGEFNDSFIEIKKGLKEGERVLLRPPQAAEPGQDQDGEKPDADGKGKTAPATPPASGPGPAGPAA